MLFPNVAILLLGKTHVAGALLRRPSLSMKRAVMNSCWGLHKVAISVCLEAGRAVQIYTCA